MQYETLSKYIQDTSTRQLAYGFRKIYLHCHRSYHYRPNRTVELKRKTRGSYKMGKSCPSRIEILSEKVGGKSKYFVKFWKTHCGHKCDFEYSRRSKHYRKKKQRKQQIEIEEILQEDMPDMKINNLIEFGKENSINKVSSDAVLKEKANTVLELMNKVSLDSITAAHLETELDNMIGILEKAVDNERLLEKNHNIGVVKNEVQSGNQENVEQCLGQKLQHKNIKPVKASLQNLSFPTLNNYTKSDHTYCKNAQIVTLLILK